MVQVFQAEIPLGEENEEYRRKAYKAAKSAGAEINQEHCGSYVKVRVETDNINVTAKFKMLVDDDMFKMLSDDTKEL